MVFFRENREDAVHPVTGRFRKKPETFSGHAAFRGADPIQNPEEKDSEAEEMRWTDFNDHWTCRHLRDEGEGIPVRIPDDAMLPWLDATDGLAAAYCHFIESSRPTVAGGAKSWKDFARKNKDKVHGL